MGIMHPAEVMKNIVPVIMAGILGIYGLIVAAILVGKSALKKRRCSQDADGPLRQFFVILSSAGVLLGVCFRQLPRFHRTRFHRTHRRKTLFEKSSEN
jgi:ATP synthase proteolipid subunit